MISDSFEQAETRVVGALGEALQALRWGDHRAFDRGVDSLDWHGQYGPTDITAKVVIEFLSDLLRATWKGGWQPVDLVTVISRNVGAKHAELVSLAIVSDFQHDAGKPMHPEWDAQLRDLLPYWEQRNTWGPHWLTFLCTHIKASRREVIELAVRLVAELQTLPILPKLIPPPGPGAAAWKPNQQQEVLDDRVLSKIRALLAKAESTQFPEEAESFTVKAQEFMTRYSIDQAMLEAGSSEHHEANAKRVHLESPYTDAKASLLGVVATANQCRAILDPKLGFVTLFGFDSDLHIVMLLFTSLLSQATSAMVAAERVVAKKSPTNKTRSFRQSFLVAYAVRIGQRLREAAARSQAEAAADLGDTFLPVLASKEESVDKRTNEAFPKVVRRTQRVSNAAGWEAGKLAADQAQLGAWAQVKSGDRSGKPSRANKSGK